MSTHHEGTHVPTSEPPAVPQGGVTAPVGPLKISVLPPLDPNRPALRSPTYPGYSPIGGRPLPPKTPPIIHHQINSEEILPLPEPENHIDQEANVSSPRGPPSSPLPRLPPQTPENHQKVEPTHNGDYSAYGSQAPSGRPMSPPPELPLAVNSTPSTSHASLPPVFAVILEYQPRIETSEVIQARLGPIPTTLAPSPKIHENLAHGEELSQELINHTKPVASPTTARYNIDLGGYHDAVKPQKSSSIFGGFLSRPGHRSVHSGSESHSKPVVEHEKLRVHYKPLTEVAEGFFAPVVPEFAPNEHRDRVAFEFFTSEQSYNNFLKILIHVYRNPLLSAQKAGDVACKDEDVKKVFGSIEAILAASDIILGALHDKIKNWNSETQTLGDVFVKYGDVLKVYATFAREQQQATVALDSCKNKTNFANILKLSRQFPACQSRDLASLQIMPIQRIPRYELLLRDFIKATPQTHPDFTILNQALTKVKSVAEQVDRSVEEYKNLEKNLEIQNSFTSFTNLVLPGRKFVKEGSLIKVCRRANKTRMFWLFNDLLLYGIPIMTGTFVISAELPLLGLRLDDMPEPTESNDTNSNEDNAPNVSGSSHNNPAHNSLGTPNGATQQDSAGHPLLFGFVIQSRSKSFVVYAATRQEKVNWMLAIMTTAASHATSRKTILATGDELSQDVAPTWQPDAAAAQCLLCKNAFGVLTRRHHCRRCGIVVCDDCSRKRAVLPGLADKSVRVCDRCSMLIPSHSSTTGQLKPSDIPTTAAEADRLE